MVSVLSETPHAWHLDLHGLEVLLIHIDYRVSLMLQGEFTYDGSVVLATPFELRSPGEAPLVLDPADHAMLGPVLRCFKKTVDSAVVSPQDGSLTVEFTDGTTIAVAAHERYEAWEASLRADPSRSKHGVLVIASPGGGEPYVFDSRDAILSGEVPEDWSEPMDSPSSSDEEA